MRSLSYTIVKKHIPLPEEHEMQKCKVWPLSLLPIIKWARMLTI